MHILDADLSPKIIRIAYSALEIGSGAKLASAATVREGLRASGGVIDRIVQTPARPVLSRS
jgi:hypothetical protein